MPHPARRRWPLLLGCCCLLVPGARVRAVEVQVAVIASRHAPHLALDRGVLRNVYLKKVFVDQDGQRLIPVNLPPGAPLRDAFVRAVIHMPDAQLQDYWNRQYFQGVSPPYVLGSQAAVARFVAETPGALGYVLPCYAGDGVRVVLMLSLPAPAGGTDLGSCPAPATP
jgi:hypothetical protein